MKFSWKWLNQLIDLKNISLNDVTDKLTLAGFEVEAIEEKPEIKDVTITLSVTANRADACSMIGLAREISTIFNIKLSENLQQTEEYNYKYFEEFKNINKNLICNSLLDIKFSTITKLEQKKSPTWLKNHLEAYDIESNNILSDIVEYINIKWGQDIEIFDLQKIDKDFIDSSSIRIDIINTNEKHINNVGFYNHKIEKPLDILKYKNKILSIIGLKSNPQFNCDVKTSSIMILGQICNPKYIGDITWGMKNKTEKSNKHLKTISRYDLLNAYEEIIQLILTLNKGYLSKSHNYHKLQNTKNKIIIQKRNINNILGVHYTNKDKYLSEKRILNILKQLQFAPLYKKNTFIVTIPEYRQTDIKRPIDVIEEIARIYGFNNFFDEIPQNNKLGHTPEIIILIKKIRQILRNLGLHEVIHYSLEDKKEKYNPNIKLYNPLIEDQSQLRNCLITNLINAKKYNIKQKNLPIESFEIGRIFEQVKEDNKKNNYKESLYIAGIMGHPTSSRTLWSEKGKALSWLQAKGLLEEFFEKLNADIYWIKPKILPKTTISKYWSKICHSHRLSILYNKIDQEQIGIFSQLSTKLNNELNSNHPTYIFELNLLNLMKTIKNKQYLDYDLVPYSNYPSVSRDISLKLYKNETVESIQKQILEQGSSLIESVKIFNEYTNKNNTTNNRYIGFRINYRSHQRTLNDKDIKNIDTEINHILNRNNKITE